MQPPSNDAYSRSATPQALATSRTSLQALPFAGLGFDLSAAAVCAQVMTWLDVRAVPRSASRGPLSSKLQAVPALAGFDLLLFLGREIRGR